MLLCPGPGVWDRKQARAKNWSIARGMPDQFDIVVAGAGHNSLIAAAYLAKAGFRCLVLESRAMVGGGVKTAQIEYASRPVAAASGGSTV